MVGRYSTILGKSKQWAVVVPSKEKKSERALSYKDFCHCLVMCHHKNTSLQLYIRLSVSTSDQKANFILPLRIRFCMSYTIAPMMALPLHKCDQPHCRIWR
ncbi:hypothetical protein VNO77_00172 [Canavalia gladiata]|uniref:Uncharacterized protein n=1 Tax=Canavalia gladiata TaxID=3824 RepID=A0AAN9MPK3_CANGL